MKEPVQVDHRQGDRWVQCRANPRAQVQGAERRSWSVELSGREGQAGI